MGFGGLGSHQCVHAIWKRQRDHRSQTSIDGTRAADAIHAADGIKASKQNQAEAGREAVLHPDQRD